MSEEENTQPTEPVEATEPASEEVSPEEAPLDDSEFVERELTEAELSDKRRLLETYKLAKEASDIQIGQMESDMDSDLPNMLLKEAIARVEKDIEDKVFRPVQGNFSITRPATEGDMLLMQSELKSMKEELALNHPIRELRLKISTLKSQKERPDAPDKQISKLEKEIRFRKETTLKTRYVGDQPEGYIR